MIIPEQIHNDLLEQVDSLMEDGDLGSKSYLNKAKWLINRKEYRKAADHLVLMQDEEYFEESIWLDRLDSLIIDLDMISS